jgi:hypothetical protein
VQQFSTPRPQKPRRFLCAEASSGGDAIMPYPKHLLEKARQFARALDECDYHTAASYLSANCRYDVGPGDSRIGPESIVASYRESDEKARREFDAIEYDSEVESSDSVGITLMFFDKLRKGGDSHVFRCSQVVYFDEDERIARIELHEIAGEREKLNEFRRLHTPAK